MTASASPGSEPVHPGKQVSPPGPTSPRAPALETDPRQRRAIRGCPVNMDCRDPARAGLIEFELETFGRSRGDSPWLADDAPHGGTARRAVGARRSAGSRAKATRGSQLRPDLPWLDDLEMPDLPVRWDERLIEYLLFYKDDPRGRNIMAGWLRAQGKYRDLIVDHLRRARLPEDLLYVAMIESSYDPREYSRVGAAGLWQFMPAGGKIYGLTIDRWVDERNDPVRSTEAAMLYWADLYQRFGDWHLAMAAYNGGYGAMLRAVATFNSNDFWELASYENAMPWGSSLYVPKALATAIVGRNRQFFGFDDVTADEPVAWDTVTVGKSVSLGTLARAAGTTAEVVRELNPQLRRNRTPPGQGEYRVRIPRGRAPMFAERFPQLRGDWDQYDAYVVSHGERFEDVATLHGISRNKLAKLNGVSHESEVRGGMVLVVPQVSEAEKQTNRDQARQSLYTSGVPGGQDDDKLVVAVPDKEFQVNGKQRVFYRVVTGDTLYDVAKAFTVSRTELAAWNGLRRDAHLHPRMILQLFVPRGFAAEERGVALLDPERLQVVSRGSDEHLDTIETRRGRERYVYRATGGETLESIGKKYGLTARDLARINRLPPNTVAQAGDEIVVYRVVDAKRSDRAENQARSQRRARRGKSKPNRARKPPRSKDRPQSSVEPAKATRERTAEVTEDAEPPAEPTAKPTDEPAAKPTEDTEETEDTDPPADPPEAEAGDEAAATGA